MDVYIFQAALLCEQCGERVRERLTEAGKAPSDPADDNSYDSDDFPKGPFPDGGGEADSPQYCDEGENCILAKNGRGVFLENSLTRDGQEYVQDACEAFWYGRCGAEADVITEWADFYDIKKPTSVDPRAEQEVRDAAKAHFVIDVYFEHGQWRVAIGGKTWLVVDVQSPSGNNGIDFEEVD